MDVGRGPVVFACDGGYAMPLATAVRSLVDADPAGCPHDIHVLCHAFPKDLRDEVVNSLPMGSVKLTWIEPDLSRFDRFHTKQYPSRMVYARLLIAEIFPRSVSRVLYLDVDVLVLGSLSALWATELGDCVIGATLDGLDDQIKNCSTGADRLPQVQRYFNSGVLLIDLNCFRAERVAERALEYLEANPDSPYPDQDALNVACDGRWRELTERWNFHVTKWDGAMLVETDLVALPPEKMPAIAHFVTSQKPWIVSSLSLNTALYYRARAKTRFRQSPIERMRDDIRAAWYRAKRGIHGLARGPGHSSRTQSKPGRQEWPNSSPSS